MTAQENIHFEYLINSNYCSYNSDISDSNDSIDKTTVAITWQKSYLQVKITLVRKI